MNIGEVAYIKSGVCSQGYVYAYTAVCMFVYVTYSPYDTFC